MQEQTSQENMRNSAEMGNMYFEVRVDTKGSGNKKSESYRQESNMSRTQGSQNSQSAEYPEKLPKLNQSSKTRNAVGTVFK